MTFNHILRIYSAIIPKDTRYALWLHQPTIKLIVCLFTDCSVGSICRREINGVGLVTQPRSKLKIELYRKLIQIQSFRCHFLLGHFRVKTPGGLMDIEFIFHLRPCNQRLAQIQKDKSQITDSYTLTIRRNYSAGNGFKILNSRQ